MGGRVDLGELSRFSSNGQQLALVTNRYYSAAFCENQPRISAGLLSDIKGFVHRRRRALLVDPGVDGKGTKEGREECELDPASFPSFCRLCRARGYLFGSKSLKNVTGLVYPELIRFLVSLLMLQI